MMILAPLLVAALAVSPVQSDRAERGEAALAKRLEGRIAGEPVSCIPLRTVRSSRVIDGTAIVYDAGRTLYVNRPSGASQLRRDDALVVATSIGQLCSADIVQLLDTTTRFPRGSVGLGQFVPYDRPERARVRR